MSRSLRAVLRARTHHAGRPGRGKPLGLSLAALALLATALPAPASGATLHLAKVGPDGAAACHMAGHEVLACGDFGSFLISADPPPAGGRCAARYADYSSLGRYPVPAPAFEKQSSVPCAHGDCFTAEPRGDWVAVVDWDDPHGWSVGETILQGSGGRVEAKLYSLGESGIGAIDGINAVGDFHVLAQLCRVAEDARQSAPLALNLSFGRLAEKSCGGPADVGCLIADLISHLRARHGVATFAAAGNHGRLLFPARVATAVAVGAVDLRHLRRHAEVRPIPQTPRGVAALFPGQGIFLEHPAADDPWPAPPGSSYASALAAGWYAGFRSRAPRLAARQLDACTGTLGPAITRSGFRLACAGRAWPGSRLERPDLLEMALGRWPASLAAAEHQAGRSLEIERPEPRLPARVFDEVQRDLNLPTPEGRPCVPCVGGGGGGTTGGDHPGIIAPIRSGPGPEDGALEIDLSHSIGIPRDLELLGLYLQVGHETHRFSDSENSTLLGEIALGEVERLEIFALPDGWRFRPMALVYALRWNGGEPFRSATPILIHD